MTLGEFEQLVCAALDAPNDAELAARIDAAIAADAALAAVLAEWRRFDAALRRGLPAPRGVHWSVYSGRIGAAVAEDAAVDAAHSSVAARTEAGDAGLDAVLLNLHEDVAEKVDWGRFAERVSGAVAHHRVNAKTTSAARDAATETAGGEEFSRSGIIRPRHLWLQRAAAWGSLAAAAAIAVFLFGPRNLFNTGGSTAVPPAPTVAQVSGIGTARITPAHPHAGTTDAADTARAVATASITRRAGAAPPTKQVDAGGGEVFMIVRTSAAEASSEPDTLGYF